MRDMDIGWQVAYNTGSSKGPNSGEEKTDGNEEIGKASCEEVEQKDATEREDFKGISAESVRQDLGADCPHFLSLECRVWRAICFCGGRTGYLVWKQVGPEKSASRKGETHGSQKSEGVEEGQEAGSYEDAPQKVTSSLGFRDIDERVELSRWRAFVSFRFI